MPRQERYHISVYKRYSDPAAVALELPWQCRHDPNRRYLTAEACKKAPLKDLTGRELEICKKCEGPRRASSETKGKAAMNANPQPQAEQSAHDPLAVKELAPAGVADAPPPSNESDPVMAALGMLDDDDAPAEPAAPACKSCGRQPAKIRKDGKSLGVCGNCAAQRMVSGRQNKAADTPTVAKRPAGRPPTINKDFEAVVDEMVSTVQQDPPEPPVGPMLDIIPAPRADAHDWGPAREFMIDELLGSIDELADAYVNDIGAAEAITRVICCAGLLGKINRKIKASQNDDSTLA